MNLYEIIRWGNDKDCEIDGGPDGSDTCYLVRSDTVENASAPVDVCLRECSHDRVAPYSQVAYLLGVDVGDENNIKILRGPYFQNAYRHGWRMWHRDSKDGEWYES